MADINDAFYVGCDEKIEHDAENVQNLLKKLSEESQEPDKSADAIKKIGVLHQ